MLTTNGKLVPLLENKLKKILGVKYLILVCNGTIALQIAIRVLKYKKRNFNFTIFPQLDQHNGLILKLIFLI